MSDVYRAGGPTHSTWVAELQSAQNIICEYGALVVDPDDGWRGVDTSKLEGLTVCGVGFTAYYQGLINTGYYHGWI